MKAITTIFAAVLLAGTSSAALAATPDARIQSLEDQIQSLAKQLQDLKADAAQQQQAVQAQQ